MKTPIYIGSVAGLQNYLQAFQGAVWLGTHDSKDLYIKIERHGTDTLKILFGSEEALMEGEKDD